MSPTVLGSISLGYQFLWGAQRTPVAVQLFIDIDPAIAVDARHLLATLRESWSEQAPNLLLTLRSPRLLCDVLDQGGASDAPWVAIPHAWLNSAPIVARIPPARQRGLTLLWHGEAPDLQPPPALLGCFQKHMNTFSAAQLLEHSRRPAHRSDPRNAPYIYENVGSLDQARQCLDHPDTWAIAGWPIEDVMRGYRGQLIQPGRHTITRLLQAVERDAALDLIENILYEDPVLPYRFLSYVNAPEHGLRHEVASVRRGLMGLGYSRLRDWLQTQLAQASNDQDLHPLLTRMVTRARLMERLLDAGEENELRREVYLCGLLSQFDLLFNEPLATIAQRIPLSERTRNALLDNSGPYAPYLEIAKALESPQTRVTHQLCKDHDIDKAEVNRALLRTLMKTTPAS